MRSAHAPRARRRWLFGETGEQLVEGDRLGATRRDGGGGLIAQSAVPEDEARRDVVEDAGKIGPEHLGVEGIDGRAVAQDAEEEHDEGRAVVAEHCDALVGPHAALGEEVGDAMTARVELGEGQPPGRVDTLEIDTIAEAPRLLAEQGVDVRRSRQIPRSAMNFA